MAEVSVVSAQAVVLYYNSQSRQWVQAGQGPSVVELYRHSGQGSYRVVARCLADQSVVINSPLYVNLEYRRATDTFHQWQDSRYAYGINFTSREDANMFGTALENAVRTINAAAQTPAPAAAPEPTPAPAATPVSAATKAEHRRSLAPASALPAIPGVAPPSQPPAQQSKLAGNAGYKTLPHKPQSAVPPPPAAPVDSAPAAPIAPSHAMPAPSGGVPPPPPPGPPPSSSSGGGGGGLADQLAAAKLKKREPSEDNSNAGDRLAPPTATSTSARPASSSAPAPMDMMGEMASKLAAKRKAAEAAAAAAPVVVPSAAAGEDQDNAPPPPPPGGPAIVVEKAIPKQASLNSVNKAAPKLANGKSNSLTKKSAIVSEELLALKAELLADFRAELDRVKAEILAAIRQ